MRYFVTGATGFIGRHLTRQLIADGHQVVALARQPAAALDLEELGVELVEGDLANPAPLVSAMADADGVFHLAAWYKIGAGDRSMAEAVNVQGTRNVLDAARRAGVPRVVYTSSVVVFGDTRGRVVDQAYRFDGPWINEYERTKWVAHYEVALPMIDAGHPVVIVQPGLVYGPGDTSNVGDALRGYLRRRLPVIPSNGGCFAHVADTARGHIQAMDRGQVGASYVLGGECQMWGDVLRLAHELTGVRPPRLTLPAGAARLASRLMTPLAAVVPLPQMYHPETLRVAGGVTYWADDALARREIGWDPRPLREGLAQTLEAEQAALT